MDFGCTTKKLVDRHKKGSKCACWRVKRIRARACHQVIRYMSTDRLLYQPNSKILIVTICSLNKKAGGTSRYNEKETIGFKLKSKTRDLIITNRNKALNLLWSGKIKWQGIPLPKLDYNKDLNRGKDFGGTANFARYLPAIERYDGRFSGALGEEGKDKLLRSRHHVLFLSGLYGLVAPMEPIQLYSFPVEGKSKVKEIWKKGNILTGILVEYVKINEIKRVFDFTSRADYRELISWDTVTTDTGAEVFHCFSIMGGGADALIPFGKFMKDFMLEASEEELLAIKPETEMYGIVIRDVRETWDKLPKEELIRIRQAESEIPQLRAYPVEEIPNKLGIYVHGVHERDFVIDRQVVFRRRAARRAWLISFTSEFRKNLRQIGDKKKEGRILGAITELSQHPTEPRGNTVKRLRGYHKGKWRIRIGKHRLVYFPDTEKQIVYLLLISTRENVYD